MNSIKNKKAVIAMSGGVDSSVAAYLITKQGYECIGATMKLFNNEDIGVSRKHTCCSAEDVEDARSVAYSLDIPYYVFNFSDSFKEQVIEKFVHAYENGMTPNPCIDCNRYLKFEKLFLRAREIDFDYVVTGHYAKIEYDSEKDRYLLKKAVDKTKDQSYVLYCMTQEQLKHTLFPLGGMEKVDVRKIAEDRGFVNANKHDSQDICFVQDKKYYNFIEQFTGKTYPEGDFVDLNGDVIGRHNGIIRYTIGQRRGLGVSLSNNPTFVLSVNPEQNTVTLGREQDLYTKTLIAKSINLISVDRLNEPMRVKAKVRYRQAEQWATATQLDDDTLKIEFDEPQRAVTKGQAVVLYDDDTVVGGGIIQ